MAVERLWYQSVMPWYGWLLLPLVGLFAAIVLLRRGLYARGWFSRYRPPVPVLVVGNLVVGGTGKTPLVIYLVQQLQRCGFKPGVVSRGYGGEAPSYPYRVTEASPVAYCGDEPKLIQRRTQVPVVVAPKRAEAVRALLQQQACDVIVTDDGMQHYALQRDIEIEVLDGRGYGNGFCLPLGPLREPLREVDFRVITQAQQAKAESMQLQPLALQYLGGAELSPVPPVAGQRVHGVAGIGHPEKFFSTLERLGYEVVRHPFPDHHPYQVSDLVFKEALPVIMTEKDAVKCESLALENAWALPIAAQLHPIFFQQVEQRIRQCQLTLNCSTS